MASIRPATGQSQLPDDPQAHMLSRHGGPDLASLRKAVDGTTIRDSLTFSLVWTFLWTLVWTSTAHSALHDNHHSPHFHLPADPRGRR